MSIRDIRGRAHRRGTPGLCATARHQATAMAEEADAGAERAAAERALAEYLAACDALGRANRGAPGSVSAALATHGVKVARLRLAARLRAYGGILTAAGLVVAYSPTHGVAIESARGGAA